MKQTYLITDGKFYKIGQSKNPKNRLSQLALSNPSLSLVCFGTGISEKSLHLKFKEKLIKKEWFELSKKDVEYTYVEIMKETNPEIINLESENLMASEFVNKKILENDFYEEIIRVKSDKRLKWPEIGEVVDKKQSAIRLAVKNKSLSELEKQAITRKFFHKKQMKGIEINAEDRISDNENFNDLLQLILKNEDLLFSNIDFCYLIKAISDKHIYKNKLKTTETRKP